MTQKNSTTVRFDISSKKADERFEYIIDYLARKLKWDVEWWDYDNEDKNKNKKGYFDSKRYESQVRYVGNIKRPPSSFYKYNHSFPTKWMCEDFEDSLEKEISLFNYQQETKQIVKSVETNLNHFIKNNKLK